MKGTLVKFICEAKSVTKRDVLIVSRWSIYVEDQKVGHFSLHSFSRGRTLTGICLFLTANC